MAAARPAVDRVLDKVAVHPLGCWEFQGARRTGYGLIGGGGKNGPTLSAHRVVYEDFVGPIPTGMTVDHLCRNPRCVNTAHMEIVTLVENARRGRAPRDRGDEGHYNSDKTHCKRGHEFTPENTLARKGGRECHACSRLRYAKLKAEREAA